MVEFHLVVHRISLDTYRPDLTGDLLTVERGFNRHWSPASQYTFHPRGIQKEAGEPAAVLAHEAVLFKTKQSEDGGTKFLSSSHSNVTLSRDENSMIVTRRGDRRWHFRSYDGGRTWMLETIESLSLPGQSIVLKYNGNNLTEVVYPDGSRTHLEYEGNSVRRVILPSGLYYRFSRDDHGWIAQVSVFHPKHVADRRVVHSSATSTVDGWKTTTLTKDANEEPGTLLYRYRYENDAAGKITKFTNPCGEQVTLDYTRTIIDGKENHAVIERSLSDGYFRIMRHRSGGGTWFQEFGIGDSETSTEHAFITQTIRRRKCGARWYIAESWDYENGRTTSEYDSKCNLVSRTSDNSEPLEISRDANGRETREQGNRVVVISRNEDGQITEVTGRDGNKQEFSYHGQLLTSQTINDEVLWSLKELDSRSSPQTATDANGQEWGYTFYPSGQMARCETPNGTILEWEYDRFGQVVIHRKTSGGKVVEIRFRRDMRGNIQQIDRPGADDDQYTWECGRLRSWTDRHNATTEYRYDSRGRVVFSKSTTGKEMRAAYDMLGRVTLLGRRASKTAPWELMRWEFDAEGRVVYEPAEGQGRRLIFGDDSRLKRMVYDDGTFTDIFYDKAGKRVASIGTHGPALFIVFDSSGRYIASLRGEKAEVAFKEWTSVREQEALLPE